MSWVKWKDHQGVRSMGENRFNPAQPWGPWTKIMGVVARCEGNHDTVVSYDGTGVTWGFMQWTFTSGRLQNLLHYLQTLHNPGESCSLFDKVFGDVFEDFGFLVAGGDFVDFTENGDYLILTPSNPSHKKRIDDICMGRAAHSSFKAQKQHAQDLAKVFSAAGKDPDIAFAQIEYAKNEFKRGLKVKRKPLREVQTIDNLLAGTWETPIPGIFYNLWQNNPAAAYRLFMNSQEERKAGVDAYFDAIWGRLNRTKFGNWSFAKPENKSPRVFRVAKGIKEFYGIDLKVRRF